MPKDKTIAASLVPVRHQATQVLGIQAGLRLLAGATCPAAQNRGFANIGRAQVQHDGDCERIFGGAGLSHARRYHLSSTRGEIVSEQESFAAN